MPTRTIQRCIAIVLASCLGLAGLADDAAQMSEQSHEMQLDAAQLSLHLRLRLPACLPAHTKHTQ